jgi:hypothetical protein
MKKFPISAIENSLPLVSVNSLFPLYKNWDLLLLEKRYIENQMKLVKKKKGRRKKKKIYFKDFLFRN